MAHSWLAIAFVVCCVSIHVQTAGAGDRQVPQPNHVVVVVFENHSFEQIIDTGRAPFIDSLAGNGALFVNAFAVAHPSQPNYLALFSGSTQSVRDNDTHSFPATPNLATALQAANKSFVGYVETGSPPEHNPWESFTNVQKVERNLSELPKDFTQLPTVAFIIPNLDHDMHGDRRPGNWRSWLDRFSWLKDRLRVLIPGLTQRLDDRLVLDGDTWLKDHLGSYAEWAKMHNSLLIVTFDEDDDHAGNHIPTIVFGAHVRPDRYTGRITHYNVFSTLLAMNNLPPLATTETSLPITAIWDR